MHTVISSTLINNLDAQSLLDFDNDDDGNHDGALFSQNSVYITVDKINDFFGFGNRSAVDIIHLNCRSLKKTMLR